MGSNTDISGLPPPPSWAMGSTGAGTARQQPTTHADISGLPPPPEWATKHPGGAGTARDNSPAGLLAQIPTPSQGGAGMAQPAAQPASPGQNWLQATLGHLTAAPEAAASMLTGAVAAPVGAAYGVGYGLTHGYGTAQGANVAERKGADLASKLTYQPSSPQARELLAGAGHVLDRSGIVGLGPDMSLLSQGMEGVKAGVPIAASRAGEAAYKGTEAMKYPFSSEASQGAIQARGMARDLQRIVPGETPMPTAPADLPVSPRAAKPSTIDINKTLGDAIDARGKQLDAQRVAAGGDIQTLLAKAPQGRLEPGQPLYQDLEGLRRDLISQQEEAGAGSTHGAYQSMINDVGRIQQTSPKPLSSLVQLRRALSEKADFGEPKQGFSAIEKQNAAGVSAAMNDILDKHLPDYAQGRAVYKDILDTQEPLRARLFKSIGADETSGDLVSRVMASQKNMDLTINAAGEVKPVDAAVSQRIQTDLHGKSLDSILSYADEHSPVLKDLPQASQVLSRAVSRAESAEAMKNLQQSAMTKFKGDMSAYTKSHATAQQYQREFMEMDKLPPKQLPSSLRSVLKKMRGDELISAEKYGRSLDQVKKMEQSINRRAVVGGLTTATTAAGFVAYALHRKMWNIIVGATE